MSDTELRPGYYIDVRAKVMDIEGDRVVIQFEGLRAEIEVAVSTSHIAQIVPRSSDAIARDPQFQTYLARLLEKRAALAPLIKRSS